MQMTSKSTSRLADAIFCVAEILIKHLTFGFIDH